MVHILKMFELVISPSYFGNINITLGSDSVVPLVIINFLLKIVW